MGNRVLFIDDEPKYVDSYIHELKGAGYKVDFVKDPVSASEEIRKHGSKFGIVILDMMMASKGEFSDNLTNYGQETGLLLLPLVCAFAPQATLIVLTNWNKSSIREHQEEFDSAGAAVLMKQDTFPFELTSFLRGET